MGTGRPPSRDNLAGRARPLRRLSLARRRRRVGTGAPRAVLPTPPQSQDGEAGGDDRRGAAAKWAMRPVRDRQKRCRRSFRAEALRSAGYRWRAARPLGCGRLYGNARESVPAEAPSRAGVRPGTLNHCVMQRTERNIALRVPEYRDPLSPRFSIDFSDLSGPPPGGKTQE